VSFRRLLAFALALGIAGWTATDALAFRVVPINNGTTLVFSADGGEGNTLTVSLDGGTYTFTDSTATATVVDPSCNGQPGDNTVTCPAAGVTRLEIGLDDQDDNAAVSADTPSIIRGDEGVDMLTGGGGQDQLDGGEGVDTLNGGAGNDEINAESVGVFLDEVPGLSNDLDGGPGDDTLSGGGGEDTVQGGTGNDTIRGWAGGDILDGGDDADALTGGAGDDTMRGGAGDDRVGDDSTSISGQPPDLGDDQLDGGDGNDVLRPGAGPTLGSDDDALNGGAGFDSVVFEQRSAPVAVFMDGAPNDGAAGEADNVAGDVERLVGGQAEDTLVGGPAAETIDGFRGADTIRGGAGADTLDGGVDDAEGDDVSGGEGDDQVRGNAGDDALAGDAGNDVVEGGGGADSASGGDGGDSVTGGPGVDAVSGGSGDDTLDGSAVGPVGVDEADTVSGDAGNDALEGGDGDDTLTGGTGVDTMSGELGSDTVEYVSARSAVEVTLNDRSDDGEQGERDNVRSDVENVSGGGVEDTFTGSGDANTLDGGTGEDFVDGRRGADQLLGGASVDVVRSRDGRADVVDCGQSRDFAIVDRADRVRRCERADSAGGRPTVGADLLLRPTAGQAEFGPPEASRTVPLLDRIEMPVGSFVDATKGGVRLTAASGRRARQAGSFRGALFRVLQRRGRRPITELRVKGGDFSRCKRGSRRGGAAAAQVRRRTIRRLRARARGRFRAQFRHSSATVRGTVFTVEDRCDGTLTRVRRGAVVVRDFRLRRTIVVRAGRSYLARAPAPRG
jgi:Ca2+-binding RTX toxin-like protein